MTELACSNCVMHQGSQFYQVVFFIGLLVATIGCVFLIRWSLRSSGVGRLLAALTTLAIFVSFVLLGYGFWRSNTITSPNGQVTACGTTLGSLDKDYNVDNPALNTHDLCKEQAVGRISDAKRQAAIDFGVAGLLSLAAISYLMIESRRKKQLTNSA